MGWDVMEEAGPSLEKIILSKNDKFGCILMHCLTGIKHGQSL